MQKLCNVKNIPLIHLPSNKHVSVIIKETIMSQKNNTKKDVRLPFARGILINLRAQLISLGVIFLARLYKQNLQSQMYYLRS